MASEVCDVGGSRWLKAGVRTNERDWEGKRTVGEDGPEKGTFWGKEKRLKREKRAEERGESREGEERRVERGKEAGEEKGRKEQWGKGRRVGEGAEG